MCPFRKEMVGVVMGENCCNYCGEYNVKLAKLPHWDDPNKFDWYCRNHWYSVRNFQNEQKERFLKHYEDEKMRKRLSEEGRELWECLKNGDT
jgi:hypothetical protein